MTQLRSTVGAFCVCFFLFTLPTSLLAYDALSSSEVDPPTKNSGVLNFPWWEKIHEESGQHVYNFIPASRRASSSVIYAYEYNSPSSQRRSVLSNVTVAHNLTKSKNHISTNSSSSSSTTSVVKDVNNVTKNINNDMQSSSLPFKNNNVDHNNTNNVIVDEYMIISGGYTYLDWRTFPVYAFPLSTTQHEQSGTWIDLSPTINAQEDAICNVADDIEARTQLYQKVQFYNDTNDDNDNEVENDTNDDPWAHATSCTPTGRMGHISGIYNHSLYIFGGLIYDEELEVETYGRSHSRGRERFRLEDIPYIYRLDIRQMLTYRLNQEEDSTKSPMPRWQRIIPRVKRPIVSPLLAPNYNSAGDILLTYINRGEMQGGHWVGNDKNGNMQDDRLIMYGGLRISVEGDWHHTTTSEHPSDVPIFSSSSSSESVSHKIVEMPLGDIWAYSYAHNYWERISSRDENAGTEESPDNSLEEFLDGIDPTTIHYASVPLTLYPRPRTAHAATVIDNQLIVHGGMGMGRYTDELGMGETDWETLDDMWIFDLTSNVWRRRWLYPPLVRSYHTLVGWSTYKCGNGHIVMEIDEYKNCTQHTDPIVAVFGGYTLGLDILSGVEAAYVFDDLLISYPYGYEFGSDSRFQLIADEVALFNDEKFSGAWVGYAGDHLTPWLKVSGQGFEGMEMIKTRYQHSAVLSKEGILTVWGGDFENTAEIAGLWMINIAGKDSTVHLVIAEEDDIGLQDTITALHTLIVLIMFMSISLTLLLGIAQRYQELVAAQANNDATSQDFSAVGQDFNIAPPIRRGNGLHPEIIDTIPRKIYNARVDAVSDEENCCPICLVDYADGDELRVLPCDHYLHRTCLDAWLANNPSCPSCRYSLRELVDDRPMMQLRTLRSRLSNLNVRFIGRDYTDDIEMIDTSSSRDTVVDMYNITDVEAVESQGEGHQSSLAQDQRRTTAIDEIRDWISSRRGQRQRDRMRLPAFEHFRTSHQRRSRIPAIDMDETG